MEKTTERHYRDIFNTEFNIAFFKPKKDQCDLCTQYTNSNITEKETLQQRYDEHLQNKQKVRELKDQDKNRAQQKENNQLRVCCFDLQKVLQTPQAKSSAMYYKRKLSVYNFTIFSIGDREGYCYVWTEHEAKRGSNEIASCVLDFIGRRAKEGVHNFVFYSDNCGGQNRNRYLYSMYVYAASKYNVHIIHRFLEKGHTQSEGDSMHARIETKSAGREIYTPQQWIEIIKTARGNPYVVIEVDREMIYNFKALVAEQQWSTDMDKNKVPLSKVKELCVDAKLVNVMQFKTDFDQNYRQICIEKPGHPLNLADYELSCAYSQAVGIASNKLKDLLSLCSTNAIPKIHHQFYKSLTKSSPAPTKSKVVRQANGESESDDDY